MTSLNDTTLTKVTYGKYATRVPDETLPVKHFCLYNKVVICLFPYMQQRLYAYMYLALPSIRRFKNRLMSFAFEKNPCSKARRHVTWQSFFWRSCQILKSKLIHWYFFEDSEELTVDFQSPCPVSS